MKYEVIDNFLDKVSFANIKNVMLSSNFPWFYSDNPTDEEESETYYFSHYFFNYYEGLITTSGYYNTVLPLITKINPNSIIRIKGNLYPNLNKTIQNKQHKDYHYAHQGAIFYINNNNGCTILNDGTKIEPKENRILFFDPSILHSSSHCTDQKVRININMNFFK